MQGKFHEKQGKTAAKPEAAHGIRKKERNFYTVFYPRFAKKYFLIETTILR